MNMRLRNEFNGEGPTRLKPWQAGAQQAAPLPSRIECWRLRGNRTGRIACATKTGRRVTVILIFLAAVQVCVALMASATTLERMSVAKMTLAAQLVVRAQCVANSARWDGGEIWTFTSFAVVDSWKGAPSGAAQQLTVRLLGGTVGNLSSTVSGVPRFRPGEEVILFLQPHRAR